MDCADQNPMPDAANFRRSPEVVMRLARMGSFHQTRLSFMRSLLRRLKKEDWKFKRNLWAINEQAQGIADFQRIVSQGLNAHLLQWKGIEATEKLAASSNAKVVVIGSGDSGLPLILGNN